MNSHTLILTLGWQPHRIVPWQESMVGICNGKLEVLETYENEILCYHAGKPIMMPAVARLLEPVATLKKGVKFSRINVFTRDDFRCCYCGSAKPMKDLNYDHVVPRRLGGETVWENIVTSCYPCNGKKAGRTPEQAKMKIRPPHTWGAHKAPWVPSVLPMNRPMLRSGEVPPAWAGYFQHLHAATG